MINSDLNSYSDEAQSLLLIFALFVFPRFLTPFKIPTGITTFILGVCASLFFDVFSHNSTIVVLSTFGIVSLFLLAGMDVDSKELWGHKKELGTHLFIALIFLIFVYIFVHFGLKLTGRSGFLFSLALVAPSTGFIISSLVSLNLNDDQKYWIKTKAISFEILALVAMFFVIRSASFFDLVLGSILIALMIFVLPYIFSFFAKHIAPYAPNSEFGFLLLIALLCASITENLGAYYLAGAFIVGIVAQRFEEQLPDIFSEKMIGAIKIFSAFFIPFYFFKSGSSLKASDFSISALAYGAVLLIILTPVRYYSFILQRRYLFSESKNANHHVALNLLPTLVFGLVIANILKTKFQIPTFLYGALIVYTLGTTLLPILLRKIEYKTS
mgnify:CR=1 FL=1